MAKTIHSREIYLAGELASGTAASGSDTSDDSVAQHVFSVPEPFSVLAKDAVTDRTKALIRWWKRPSDNEFAEAPASFDGEFDVDALLEKEQLNNTKSKIAALFNGTPNFQDHLKENAMLLSPFTQYFIQEEEQRQKEVTYRHAAECLSFEINHRTNKRQALTDKRSAVQEYIKWIQHQTAVSCSVRQQTRQRADRDIFLRDTAELKHMNCLEKQHEMILKDKKLRQQWSARKKWRDIMEDLKRVLGKSFYDMDDFCGFYEKNAAIVQMCTQMQLGEKLQLDMVQNQAEVRSEEWEAENSALQNRLQNALSEREVLTSELIDLKNLNHAFKILHENDMNEYDCLANAVEDLSFAIRTLTGVTSESQPDDNIQQLSSFERFLIMSELVLKKMEQLLGPELDYEKVFPNIVRDPVDFAYSTVQQNNLHLL